jgi:nucleoside-diphosphate-sugar epimerase
MRLLISGGSAFIGSNLCSVLLQTAVVMRVRIFDYFGTGHSENLPSFWNHPKFKLLVGSIRTTADYAAAIQRMDAIFHKAQLGSAPRSITHPATSHDVNLNGLVYLLQPGYKAGIRTIVPASLSSILFIAICQLAQT